jgi:hypothetical protein
MRHAGSALALVALAAAGHALAARERVLKQIDLPHDYYYRELYLPQATSGPQSPAFAPDGETLVYSMAGSLWRQKIGATEAIELTHANGYDYQPDWSRDGRAIVFTRYRDDALELFALDPSSGTERQLTRSHAVNLEPRWSPDGKRLAYVSTEGTGHFNLFVADYDGTRLVNPRRLVGEHESQVPRYYYSRFDHAINPAWTPDGKRLLFVSNREIAYGTGDLYSVAVDAPDDLKPLWREETSWRARPDVAPDGKRVVYSSFQGRQWHQLWLTTTNGDPPLPLTFGEFDRGDPRWSPDGRRIAYTSNERGDISLWVLDGAGGARQQIEAKTRRYRNPTAALTITARDAAGKSSLPARISVVGKDDRAYAPATSWLHADDGFDRKRQRFENHYFHCAGTCTLDVPVGAVTVTVSHGFGYRVAEQQLVVPASGLRREVELVANPLPAEYGDSVSADLHVHMNYGGHYLATPDTLAAQARAEALDVVYNLIVNKEQRVPDIARFDPRPDARAGVLLVQAQEFHSSYWGHLGLLNLDHHLLLPDFTAYRASPVASAWPHNGAVADLAHAQHALVGYVHPFDNEIVPETEKTLSNALPADVAHGKVDYYEVVGFSDHLASAHVWHRLLNLGFRLPAGAGTDAMTNYASLRGPVGTNRVFLNLSGEPTQAAIATALKQGRTLATNGPLLGLSVEGKHAGDEIALAPGPHTLRYRASLRSIVPVDHLELLYNGVAAAQLPLAGARTDADVAGEIEVDRSGWLALRAWSDSAHRYVQDIYPYASTSAIYLAVGGDKPRSPQDAAYFVRWLERVSADLAARDDFNDARERADTLAYLAAARENFAALR